MAHKVTFSLPKRDVGNADVEFLVRSDGIVLGKLLVGKRALVWRPKNKKYGKKLAWGQFDKMMQANGGNEQD
jgi:hypothetical protein